MLLPSKGLRHWMLHPALTGRSTGGAPGGVIAIARDRLVGLKAPPFGDGFKKCGTSLLGEVAALNSICAAD